MTGVEKMSGENSELNCFTEGGNGKVLFLDHNICDFTYLVMLTRTCGMRALGWRCWDSLAGRGNCPVWETPCIQSQMVLRT